MMNGNLSEYLRGHASADKLGLVRRPPIMVIDF